MNGNGNGGQNQQAAKFKLCFTAVAKLITIIFSGLICVMPKITKSEQQAVLASVMELHFATSLAAQEDPDLLYESDSDSDDGHLVEGFDRMKACPGHENNLIIVTDQKQQDPG